MLLALLTGVGPVLGQKHLTLKEAIQLGVENYGTVRAKAKYAAASQAAVTESKREYLPNLDLGAQVDYGTVNAQYGPVYGFSGAQGIASVGPPLSAQNWNAAFGSLFLTNVNWDFFAFGRAKEKIHTAMAVADRDTRDYQQEVFEEEVKVAGAYLNLLAAERLTSSYRENLSRANTFRDIVTARVTNELNPGVDSSQANAEVANAKIALTNAIDFERVQENNLIQLLGIPPQRLEVDTVFVEQVPATIPDSARVTDGHPILEYYKSRILLSNQQAKYDRTFYYPTFSLVGVYQEHGSGFGSAYGGANPGDFSHNFYDGVKPTQANYLIGVGVSWNFTQLFRVSQQVRAQRIISSGLQDEYDLAQQKLVAQLELSDTRMQDALDNYHQSPIEVHSASDAYTQKSVLYDNGLTTLIDVTQAQYVLIRAETNRDIAYSNVWQALLLKAAAAGDMNILLKNL